MTSLHSYVTNYPTLPLQAQHTNYHHKKGSIVISDNSGTFVECGIPLKVEWYHTAAQRNAIIAATIGNYKQPFERGVHTVGDRDLRAVGVFPNRKLQRFEYVQACPAHESIENTHRGDTASTEVYREEDSFVPEIRSAY